MARGGIRGRHGGHWQARGTAADYTYAPAAPVGPPAILTGLIGWWDASVTASLNLTGSDINSISDQSGGSNTMNWVNAKPSYSATGLNSKPAMTFNGTSSTGLVATNFPMGTGKTITVWAVCTMGDSSCQNGGRILSYIAAGQTNDNDNDGSWTLAREGGANFRLEYIRYFANTMSPSTTVHPAAHRAIVTTNSSNDTNVYIDGVATSQNYPVTWKTAGQLIIGRKAGNSWGGPIAECGVATGYSNPTTVASLDTYLKNKWGL